MKALAGLWAKRSILNDMLQLRWSVHFLVRGLWKFIRVESPLQHVISSSILVVCLWGYAKQIGIVGEVIWLKDVPSFLGKADYWDTNSCFIDFALCMVIGHWESFVRGRLNFGDTIGVSWEERSLEIKLLVMQIHWHGYIFTSFPFLDTLYCQPNQG